MVPWRLDRLLFRISLVSYFLLFYQWIGLGGVSDHFPIFLEFRNDSWKPKALFKFNSSFSKVRSLELWFGNTIAISF